jgi:hypothetical protein
MVMQRGDQQVAHRRVDWAPWSPAQFIALGIGALYIILGVGTLAQTGITASGFLDQHVSVLGFHHTPLLGVVELVFGLLMVMAGAIPGAARGTMSFLGILALGAGIVFIIQPASLHGFLGVHTDNGWLYIVTGIVSLLTAMIAPIIMDNSRSSVARERNIVDVP